MSYKNITNNKIEIKTYKREQLCDWGCKSLNSKYKRYTNQIGNGTYGSVYKGEVIQQNNSNNQKSFVALKKLKFENETQGFPLTALREISILKQLNHPNIVTLMDVVLSSSSNEEKTNLSLSTNNTTNNNVYLIFEYMEHDLSALLLNNVKFNLAQIKSIMFQIIQGLKYLHDKQIWHRDLKSANILYNNRGEIKIADFGLSKNLAKQLSKRKNNKCNTNRVVTLWYRAPELLLGSETYSSKIDIWALGCLFAEIILGKPLFQGDVECRQIEQIYQKCGGFDAEKEWPEAKQFKYFYENKPKSLIQYKRSIQSYIKSRRSDIEADALDLLDRMLQLNPNNRISIEEIINHPYFIQNKPKILAPHEMPRFEKECHFYETQQNLNNNIQQQIPSVSMQQQQLPFQQQQKSFSFLNYSNFNNPSFNSLIQNNTSKIKQYQNQIIQGQNQQFPQQNLQQMQMLLSSQQKQQQSFNYSLIPSNLYQFQQQPQYLNNVYNQQQYYNPLYTTQSSSSSNIPSSSFTYCKQQQHQQQQNSLSQYQLPTQQQQQQRPLQQNTTNNSNQFLYFINKIKPTSQQQIKIQQVQKQQQQQQKKQNQQSQMKKQMLNKTQQQKNNNTKYQKKTQEKMISKLNEQIKRNNNCCNQKVDNELNEVVTINDEVDENCLMSDSNNNTISSTITESTTNQHLNATQKKFNNQDNIKNQQQKQQSQQQTQQHFLQKNHSSSENIQMLLAANNSQQQKNDFSIENESNTKEEDQNTILLDIIHKKVCKENFNQQSM